MGNYRLDELVDEVGERRALAMALKERDVRRRKKRYTEPGGLLQFIRDYWHVVEPAIPLIEGWPLEAICEHLEAVSFGKIRRLLMNVPPGFMKLCADSTPILTPDGYRTHGDLKQGDRVFGPDGKPTSVLRISPKATADYEVRFSTHETIKCNGDHLWHVYDRWAKKYKVITTRELYAAPTEPDRSRFFIPDTRCLEFPERQLPLHPYFLGCWLGDGSASKPAISHSVYDTQHIDKLSQLGYAVTAQYVQNDTRHSNFCHQGIIETIRTMGLFKNKHIPVEYLTASEEQRLELLAGLIDTDGTVDKDRGRITFCTCDPGLAESVQLLVLSLGMRPYITLMDAPGYGDYASDKTYHLIGFQPDRAIPTAISRKQVARLDFVKRKRAIVSVKRSDSPELGHCITVDRKDGLYVVGRTNVITHNSLTTNVFYPAWEWGPLNKPWLRYIAASYSQSLTIRDNVRFRNIISSPQYQEDFGHVFGPSKDQFSLIKVGNDKTGWKLATSVGGVGTGERGNRFIIDDGNSVAEAESDAVTESTNQWFREVVPTRLNNMDSDVIINIQQRTSERDISGVIMDEGLDYVHLMIPMEYDSCRHCSTSIGWSDPRAVDGELAWQERFSPKSLRELKSTLGPYAVAGQLQQIPAPRGGGIIKREYWQIWESPDGKFPACDFILASLDSAYTEKEENDPSGFTVWGVFKHPVFGRPRAILMHAWRKRLHIHGQDIPREAGESEVMWRRRAEPEWGLCEWVAHSCRRFKVNTLLIENKASGKSVSQELRRLYGNDQWQVIERDIIGDKFARAHAVQPEFAKGLIYRPDRDWAQMVEDETAVFPRGRYKDLTDSTTLAIKWLRDNGMLRTNEEVAAEERDMMMHRSPQGALYPI